MRFRDEPDRITGSVAPVVTPFSDTGELDTEGLRGLVRWQLASGSHGISLGGSTGEPSAQSVGERAEAISIAASEISDRVPFVPGTGSTRMDETLRLTSHAEATGADAALVITPYYARPTQEALYEWYATVAREFPGLPLIVYNVPSRTGVDIAPRTVARLFRDFDNIVGIKETTKDFEHFSRVMRECGPELLVWSGIESLCLPLLALGGVGFVSATANLAPAAVARMYEAWREGDAATARELHFRLHPLADLIFTEANPAAAKWVLARRGLISSGYVRPPLIPLTPEGRTAAEALLAECRDLLSPLTS